MVIIKSSPFSVGVIVFKCCPDNKLPYYMPLLVDSSHPIFVYATFQSNFKLTNFY